MKNTGSYQLLQDIELIDLALENNQRAWREIVNRYYAKVCSTVLRVQGKGEHEDTTQEVFIELAKSLKNFRRESSFSTFLYRVTVNTCYRKMRKKERINLVGDAMDFISSIFTSKNDDTNPARITGKIENIGSLNSALRKLTPEKRIAVILFDVEGLSLKQMATIFKIPLPTVWSRVYHGRKELLKHMERYTK